MTVPIQVTDIRPETIVTGSSRYATRKVIYYSEHKFITFDTYIRTKYKPDGKEKVMVINKGVEFRPDLVSFDFYGSVDYWWKIMEANNIKDIYDFKAGRTILLPHLF
jgi:hypothetical protein